MSSRAGYDRECDQSGQKGNGHRQRHQRWKRRRKAEQETAGIRGGEGGRPGTWPGLRDARPKLGREIGVGGDRAPSNLAFVNLRGTKIEGAERDQLLSAFFFLLFIFFFIFLFFFIMRSLFLGTRSFVQR